MIEGACCLGLQHLDRLAFKEPASDQFAQEIEVEGKVKKDGHKPDKCNVESVGVVVSSQEIFAGCKEMRADSKGSFRGRIHVYGIDLLVEFSLIFHNLVLFVDFFDLVRYTFVVVEVEPLEI